VITQGGGRKINAPAVPGAQHIQWQVIRISALADDLKRFPGKKIKIPENCSPGRLSSALGKGDRSIRIG
jgi:hypothetical protein